MIEKAQSGYTQMLANMLVESNYASVDRDGFQRAMDTYEDNAARIEGYRKGMGIDEQSLRIGFAIAKLLAYLALGISVINIMHGR